MAARHEIQNLIRRGNVFHWRPRIPRGFSGVGESHLSLSLHHSDHRKAQYMARRLNTLLHEMKMTPGAAVTTKDQLEALFRAEADRMAEHLDTLQFAARRTGSDPMLSIRADLEVGWAYRLIEMFGTMRRLIFDPGCPGRAALERAGIPEPSIGIIAETFAQEQAGCRHPSFEKALRADMKAHGIADTLVNRERATAELMRAKADMLLAAPSRYPEFGELGLADIVREKPFNGPAQPTEQASQVEGTESSAKSAPAVTHSRSDVVLETEAQSSPYQAGDPASAAVPEPGTTAISEVENIESVAMPPEKAATPLPARPSGVPLAVSDFMDKCEGLIKSKRSWDDKTAQDVRVVVQTFAGILGEHGVADVAEIEQYHLGQLRDHFDNVLARYGQSGRLRKLSTTELRAASAKRVELARERNEEPPKIGLGSNTIRKHLGNLAEFLRYLEARGYAVGDLSMDGLRPAKMKQSDVRTLTDKPGPDRLRPMFQMPVFTGCIGAENQDLQGDAVFHSANYFIPMLLTYLGARRSEITGLAVRDIKETVNGWAIDIRVNPFRTVKNAQSIRLLPVPDEVLRLGFVPYVKAIRDLGYQALFPELHHPTEKNNHGDRFYDDFKPLADAFEELDHWRRFLHALRHGQADTIFQQGVDTRLINDIAGRLSEGETNIRYTNVAGLPLVRDALAKYPSVTDHLKPQPLMLLPWVANRRPAPWTDSTQSKRLANARSVRAERSAKRKGTGDK